MLVGYAHVSTHDQNLDLQKDALKKAGCRKVFVDVASGVKAERPGLAEALKYARQDETHSWSGSSTAMGALCAT